jgi:hypothetical protein
MVVQAPMPYKGNVVQTVLDLAPEGREPESEGLTHLEVVRQVSLASLWLGDGGSLDGEGWEQDHVPSVPLRWVGA